ncbi:MAG: class I SAM-dependent methyltransferase [Phycisphaerales bacterium]
MDPAPPHARLATLGETRGAAFSAFMANLNRFARPLDLREFTTWSKIWEYPWLWFNGLGRIGLAGARVVDLGSEKSPMPWAMAALGARVTLIEADSRFVPLWARTRDRLGAEVDWHIVDSHRIPLPDASVDVLTSFSVIEHQPDKAAAIAEAARVLKPGGLFTLSFDICEPQMGMTFPEWNGRALTMRDFEDSIWNHPAFSGSLSRPPPDWNVTDIPEFLAWHRTTAPHHNYVVGAAVMRRT